MAVTRQRFIEQAPLYYALAILLTLRKRGAAMSWIEFMSEWTVEDKDDPLREGDTLLGREELFHKAISWLMSFDAIELIEDDFAPVSYKGGTNVWGDLSSFADDSPLTRYVRAGAKESWLYNALVKMDAEYVALGIAPADFENPNIEWSPITLDQNDPDVQNLISKVEETIESVWVDNGYATSEPGEQAYVLDSLRAVSKRLKEEATITVSYVQAFALEPLQILLRRFANTSRAALYSATRAAFLEVLKKYMKEGFEHLVSMIR